MNPKTIAISNQKGGVGKTTTAANLGIGLVQEGKKTLLIDLDPQASLTISLGYPQPDKLPCTVTDLMIRNITNKPISAEDAILHHAEGIDLIPANIELSGMEASLVNVMSRETVLRQVLADVRGQYDYVLIDCSDSSRNLDVPSRNGCRCIRDAGLWRCTDHPAAYCGMAAGQSSGYDRTTDRLRNALKSN